MSEKHELETMADAIEKLGRCIMINSIAVAEELAKDGLCAFEPTAENRTNKVFALTSYDIDWLPASVKTLLKVRKARPAIRRADNGQR